MKTDAFLEQAWPALKDYGLTGIVPTNDLTIGYRKAYRT